MIKEKPAQAISIHDVSFGYKKNVPLIKIKNWHIAEGSHTFLYGASGSGKSTLLNLLSGILTPQVGEIRLLEQDFSKLSTAKRDAFRAQHIGIVFQEFNLIPFLTITENINLAKYFVKGQKENAQASAERMKHIFDRLQLSEKLLLQRADTLSVGQRQRVSIARALVNQPKILIADEPTSSLDSDNRDEFMQILLETTMSSSCTVLFVSHDKSLKSHFSHTQDMSELLA